MSYALQEAGYYGFASELWCCSVTPGQFISEPKHAHFGALDASKVQEHVGFEYFTQQTRKNTPAYFYKCTGAPAV